MEISLTVNGERVVADIEGRLLLVHFLRDELGLRGTHVGCDSGYCGACTVLVDGAAVKSCTMLAVQADGRAVATVEGLAGNGDLHPLQRAFVDHRGLQCGYCTPGMLMSAKALLDVHPSPDEFTIRSALEGNLCRCTGYESIVRAVGSAARELRTGREMGSR